MKKIFKNNGKDFGAFYEAEEYAKGLGFSVGSMQRDELIGLSKIFDVPKWRDLTQKGIDSLCGTIRQIGGFRNGDVEVEIFEKNQGE